MANKHLFITVIASLMALQAIAQNNFSIKVTQVYPAGNVVYGNTYNLSSELEAAERTLRAQYTGRDANYTMELTRPSGKDTKTIQNIHWILIENGVRKNLKSKPTLADYYQKVTSIELYACNNNGAKIESAENVKALYDHHLKFFINDQEAPFDYAGRYLTEKDSKTMASVVFEKNKPLTDDKLYEVRVFKDKTHLADISVTNKNEYDKYQALLTDVNTPKPARQPVTQPQRQPQRQRQPQPESELDPEVTNSNMCVEIMRHVDANMPKAKRDEKYDLMNQGFNAAMGCIDLESGYSFEVTNRNLALCEKAAGSYVDKNNFLQIKQLVETIDAIFNVMETNPNNKPVKFDREKFLRTANNVGNVKSWIKTLRKINDSL